MPQTATLRLFNDFVSNICLINDNFLLSKFHFEKSRNKNPLDINELLVNIHKIKVTAFGNVNKVAACIKKWDITNRKFLW